MITYTALAPHPPLIIPEVGRSRINDVQLTVDGMRSMAAAVAASAPDTIVLFTPHGNVFADAVSALSDQELEGNLKDFGVQQKWTGIKNDLPLLMEIASEAVEAGIDFVMLDNETARRNRLNPCLDHGILVPWYYLQEAGLRDVKIIAISIAFLPIMELYKFGALIGQAAEKMGRRIAVLASGDMSHRLKDDGPYEFDPNGPVFDETIQELLRTAQVEPILELPESMRDQAGECGYRSIVIMLGALDGMEFTPQIFSYEGTFGVGYLVAGFQPGAARSSLRDELQNRHQQAVEKQRSQESSPVKWARMVLESYIAGGKVPSLPEDLTELKQQKAGTFVSLKKHGSLRGCIGTISPAYGNLAEEIAGNAVSAGTRDPRFMPVEAHELDDLVYSVDILGPAEPSTRPELDPRRYGVIVSRGGRRGLLLPDLEGVDTVEEQLNIALQKAGIKPDEDYQIERFEVIRYT